MLPVSNVVFGTLLVGNGPKNKRCISPGKEIEKRNGHRNRKKKRKEKGEERELLGPMGMGATGSSETIATLGFLVSFVTT